jgi:hypothetical protein
MLWKTTSNGRRPQKLKLEIYQQPLVGSYPNFELGLRGPPQMSWTNEETSAEGTKSNVMET